MKQCTPVKPHKYDKLEYLCAVQHFNCNIPKIEVEKNVKYLDTITPLNEYDALGGYERDTIYLVIPHNQEDINCLNIINGYFCQYCEPLFEDETSKYKEAINYLLNTFQSCREYSNEGEKFHLLGGFGDDRVFVVRPRRIEDIDCINTINKYITNGTSILNYYNIGEIYIF